VAKEYEPRDDQWGNKVARITFLVTAVGAALFIGAVFMFVLTARV
jgi:hypothetical protein